MAKRKRVIFPAKKIPKRITTKRGILTGFQHEREKAARGYERGWSSSVRRVLKDLTRQASRLAADGLGPDSLDLARFERNYFKAKQRWTYTVTKAGWDVTDREVRSLLNPKGKSVVWSAKNDDDVPVMIGGGDTTETERGREFLLSGNFSNIDRWVQTTADAETKTKAGTLGKVWRDAATNRDPETGRAWTPAQISKSIRERGFTDDEHRSDMLARTGTIWSMNEGALQRYTTAGVRVTEWIATSDDVTCPFCLQMHNKYVGIGEPYWTGDVDMGVRTADGKVRTLTTYGDVNHPPLHPNCRCCIVPIVHENQIRNVSPKKLKSPKRTKKPKIASAPKASTSKDPKDMTQAEWEAYRLTKAEELRALQQAGIEKVNEAVDRVREAQASLVSLNRMIDDQYLSRRLAIPDDIRAKLVASEKRCEALRAERNILEHSWKQDIQKILATKNPTKLTANTSRIRQKNILRWNEDATDGIGKTVDASVVDDGELRADITQTGSIRSFHTPNHIQFSSYLTRQTAYHEWGHELEESSRVREAARAFFKRRTEGLTLKKLKDLWPGHGYKNNEYAYANAGFVDPYVGKKYASGHTEVVSMGLEYMHNDPVKLLNTDPDHFNFMMDLMHGRIQ